MRCDICLSPKRVTRIVIAVPTEGWSKECRFCPTCRARFGEAITRWTKSDLGAEEAAG